MLSNTQEQSRRTNEMFAVVEQYKKSGQSQKAFCQQINLPYSTLQYWLKRYRESRAPNSAFAPEEKESGFLTLVPVKSADRQKEGPACHIEFPNGVKLTLRSPINVSLILEIVQGYGG